MNRIAAFLLIVAFCIPAHAGQCHVLYRQQAVVVNHHGYAQQFVAPIVHYAVGSDIQNDAVAEKIAQRVAAKLQALQPAQAVKQGSTVKAATSGVMIAKCSRCHTGDDARGYTDESGKYHPIRLDSSPMSADDFRRVVKVLFNGEVPAEMQGLVAGLNAEAKGAITDEAMKYSDPAYVKAGTPNSEAGVLE